MTRTVALAAALLGSLAAPAAASFHLMQIEQVAGGVCGDYAQQAIQLRMRFSGQRFVAGAQLVAHDAAGLNPVVLITFPGDVANGAAGDRILATTAAFSAESGPTPDFTLEQPIPVSYLAAGRLTFQTAGGTVYWSLAWGGAGYTGSHAGSSQNDDDGDFGPAIVEALPAVGGRAALFAGAAGDTSTTNLADYAVTGGDAVWTNNAGVSAASSGCVFGDGFESGDVSAWSSAIF